MDDYDILVAGGGLAGLTAGLFAARHGRRTLVLEPSAPGGHLINVPRIEDFPGFPEGVPGFDLGPMVQEQAANEGAAFAMETVTAVEPDGDGWIVATEGDRYRAGAVILAMGTRLRELGVPGETRLYGKGVSHCASCDGPLYRGQTVGVVAEDEWAIQEALTLAEYASQVVVFHQSETPTGQQVFLDRLRDEPKLTSHPGTTLLEIVGEDGVTGVRVRDAANKQEITVDLNAVFVYAGLQPNTDLLRDLLPLDASGHVPMDAWMRTARPGLFAVGSIRSDAPGLALTASADGAVAAIAAHRYLADHIWNSP
jgi:thioredoxin reductase (NADPH)